MMVLVAPLGNLSDFEVGERRLERVTVRSDDCAKRVLRLATSAGDVGVRFAGERRLRNGDVLYADDERVVAVAVEADDVIVGRPPTIAAALGLAHALGNRHLPVQIDGDEIVVRYDPLLPGVFAGCEVPFARERRVLNEPFRHAHAPHGHD
ncbi:MAG: urease accessory protein [Candidatus Eremiobacteraeota bacterium]|nr:urease accessory protein [Candidatus Eremiobacteraeota bacterium]